MLHKKVIQIYDQIAEEYSRRYDRIESKANLVFLNAFLKHLEPGSIVVDLGCGTGYTAGYFTKKGMIVEGVDLSSSMISIAKRNYPIISFLHADIRVYEPGKVVDAVWAGYSMFHLKQKDFETTLDKVRGYLKPAGVFGLVMQEGEGELEADEPLLPGEKIYMHLYTEKELNALLQKHGFDVIEQQRKKPMYEMEFPYNKILLIAK